VLKLEQGKLPTGNLRIHLEGDHNSRFDIQRHLETIGDTYSRKWSYDRSRREMEPFVSIQGTYRVPATLTSDLGYGAETIEMETEGVLWPGHGDDDSVGFHASLLTETNFLMNNDEQGGGEYDWVKEYPCRHVPVPADW
jgi:hypothetical protein